MKNTQHPPGSFGLPIIGETFAFVRDSYNFVKTRYHQHGTVFKTNILGRPTVVMVGPEAIEFLLSSHIEYFSWREGWPENFKTLLGKSLFIQDGEEHRRNRRLIMPALHGPALADYVATMKEITDNYLQQWQNKQEFTWFEEFKKLTFDIASQLLLGTNSVADNSRLSQLFTQLTNGLFAINPLVLPFTTLGKAIAARNQILEHLAAVVKERQEHPSKDAISLLVQAKDEDGNSLSQTELMAQAVLLLFAGHETTTSMLTWLCVELARHPEILQRAREEQLQLLTYSPA